jgi:methylthioribose-1-phosphate isomerase
VSAHPHPSPLSGAAYSAVELAPANDRLWMLEQRLLPGLEQYVEMTRVEEVAEGIRAMVVRGAPAIGISAAYGMVLAARVKGDFAPAMSRADALLRATRPTAVNLAWALDRMGRVAAAIAQEPSESRVERLAAEARAIHA